MNNIFNIISSVRVLMCAVNFFSTGEEVADNQLRNRPQFLLLKKQCGNWQKHWKRPHLSYTQGKRGETMSNPVEQYSNNILGGTRFL